MSIVSRRGFASPRAKQRRCVTRIVLFTPSTDPHRSPLPQIIYQIVTPVWQAVLSGSFGRIVLTRLCASGDSSDQQQVKAQSDLLSEVRRGS